MSAPEGPQPKLSRLYQEAILEHYRRPRNKGTLEPHTRRVVLHNPLCGDEVQLDLLVEDGIITDVRFTGRGCSISQASASIMTELVKGQSIATSLALARRFAEMMRGSAEAATDPALGDARALGCVAHFPARITCAELAFDALEEAGKNLP
jgi:nitrogen fixation NifU-like protein